MSCNLMTASEFLCEKEDSYCTAPVNLTNTAKTLAALYDWEVTKIDNPRKYLFKKRNLEKAYEIRQQEKEKY